MVYTFIIQVEQPWTPAWWPLSQTPMHCSRADGKPIGSGSSGRSWLVHEETVTKTWPRWLQRDQWHGGPAQWPKPQMALAHKALEQPMPSSLCISLSWRFSSAMVCFHHVLIIQVSGGGHGAFFPLEVSFLLNFKAYIN